MLRCGCLWLVVSGLAAGQTFSPPTSLPGDMLVGPSAGNQRAAVAAQGSGGYLAVWEDDRSGLIETVAAPDGFNWNRDIYGMMLDADGHPLADFPFVINRDEWDQVHPQVAWNGSAYLVVWQGTLTNAVYRSEGILAARVSAAGQVIDVTPILIEDDPNRDEAWPTVASVGDAFLVAWSGFTSTGQQQIHGRIVQPDGSVGPRKNLSAASSTAIYQIAAAGVAGQALVTWAIGTSGGVRGQRVDASGNLVGGVLTLAGNNNGWPTVASNGVVYFVAWIGLGVVRGTPVDAAGTLGVAGGLVLTQPGLLNNSEIAAGWDGSQWVVAWDSSPSVFAVQVDASGMFASTTFNIDNSPRSLDDIGVANGAGKVVVLWTDRRTTPNSFGIDYDDVFGTTFSSNGVGAPSVPISVSPPAQVRPSIAGDAVAGYVVLYQSLHAGVTRLLAQRLDPIGNAIGLPFEVMSGDRAVLGGDVAWNGSECLATWYMNDVGTLPLKVYSRRFRMDGTLLDAAPVYLMEGDSPAAAAVGSTFLVVAHWHHVNLQSNAVIRTRRIDGPGGALIGGVEVLDFGSGRPDVVGFADRWLAIWGGVRGAFILQDGTSLGPFYAANQSSSSPKATVTRNGDEAVIAFGWNAGSSLLYTADVHARRFKVDGSSPDPLDGVVVTDALHGQFRPVAAPAGAGYVFAFNDYRAHELWEPGLGDVYAARIDGTGQLLDPTGIAVHADYPRAEGESAMAGDQGIGLLLTSVLQDAPHGGYRQVLRVYSEACALAGVWTDLGHALAGGGGVPSLAGTGALQPGQTVALNLSNAKAQAPYAIIVGLSQLDAPFYGGLLVPAPALVVGGLVTNVAGGAVLAAAWPAGVPACQSLVFQAWIQDPTGPLGLTASNGLRVLTP